MNDFISQLSDNGVFLDVVNGQIRIRGDRTKVDSALVNKVRHLKPALIAMLSEKLTHRFFERGDRITCWIGEGKVWETYDDGRVAVDFPDGAIRFLSKVDVIPFGSREQGAIASVTCSAISVISAVNSGRGSFTESGLKCKQRLDKMRIESVGDVIGWRDGWLNLLKMSAIEDLEVRHGG